MGLFRRTSRGPIGVDVGVRWIKAVQLAGAPGGYRIAAAAALPRAGGEDALGGQDLRRLGEVLDRQGFTGNQVVLAAPSQSLLSATVHLPPRASGAPVEQIATMEVARAHRREPATLSVAVWDIPAAASRGQEGSAAMVAACPHEVSTPLLDSFEAAGFEVVGLDLAWMALARACSVLPGTPGAPTGAAVGIIDLGWRAGRIIAMLEGVMIYERVLGESGLSRLAGELRNRLQLDDEAAQYVLTEVGLAPANTAAVSAPGSAMPPEQQESDRRQDQERSGESDRRQRESAAGDVFKEPRRLIAEHLSALCDELSASFSYVQQHFRVPEVTRVMLAGGGAAVPGVGEHLAAALQTQVQVAHPSALVAANGLSPSKDSPIMTTALGLAMHEP